MMMNYFSKYGHQYNVPYLPTFYLFNIRLSSLILFLLDFDNKIMNYFMLYKNELSFFSTFKIIPSPSYLVNLNNLQPAAT